jgi:DNA-binding CsgD family transcriptional regulator
MIAFSALRTRTMSVIRNPDPPDDAVVTSSGSIAAAVIEAANRVEYGLLLVDGDSRVHFASRIARQQLLSGQLHIQAGQLRAQSLGETVNLRHLIARCAHGGQVPDDDAACCRAGELLLQVAPLAARPPEGAPTDGHLVAIFVMDPADGADPTAEQLRAQFGLTAAEALVACEIIKGLGIRECARAIGISETTARTHLHRIFEKSGTRRQAQLVRKAFAARPIIR